MDEILDIKKEIQPEHNHHSTEKDILEAAKRVFQIKGMYGARMQEIADEAGINKAMLHYYFRSKDKLFDAVFQDAAKNFFSKIRELLNVDKPLLEKIEYFVENYVELLLQNSFIPAFIITEVHQNPDRIKNIFLESGVNTEMLFINDIKTAISLGIIHPVDPKQLIINIIGLCVFPVAAKPIIKTMLNLNDEEYLKFIEVRKKEVSKFIINAIKVH
ncbi:MAG: TetR/AcrR family transcriptional regulator [Ignavibacteria bacterium]